MANSIKIKVNGLTHGVTASLDTPLLYVLHNELHLHGPRFGCGLAQCGACSVLLDGKEIRSCVTPVAAVSGKSITTLEGLPALYAAQRGTTRGGAGAASVAAGVDRRAGAALRLLPERDDDPGRRPPRDDEEPVRGPDPHGDERASLPLRDLSENPDRDPEGRGSDGKGRCVMTGLIPEKGGSPFERQVSRRAVVKAGGALVVGVLHARCDVRREVGDRCDRHVRQQRPVRLPAARLLARSARGQHRVDEARDDRARPGLDHGPAHDRRRRAELRHEPDEDDRQRHRPDAEPGWHLREPGGSRRRQADSCGGGGRPSDAARRWRRPSSAYRPAA